MSQIFFCLQPGINGYGYVCHEPFSKTNISSRFFRRWGGSPHFRFRAPANHLASTFLPHPGQAILLGLLDVTQVRLLLIQTAVIPLPSSQWDITWHYLHSGQHVGLGQHSKRVLVALLTFGLIPSRKLWTSLYPTSYWSSSPYDSSTKMALALNNSKVNIPLNKETKPNQTKPINYWPKN